MALSKITNGGVATSGIPAGGVIQVQTFQRTTSFEQSTHGSMADCGVSVNITPTSTSNKIFILVSGMIANDTAGNATVIHLLRDSTKIAAGSGASDEKYNASAFTIPDASPRAFAINITHLDSPATTSQITYKLQLGSFNGDGFIGKRGDAGDQRVPTTITVMEIAG